MEHIESKDSSDSELQIESICSVGIFSILQVIAKISFDKSQNAQPSLGQLRRFLRQRLLHMRQTRNHAGIV